MATKFQWIARGVFTLALAMFSAVYSVQAATPGDSASVGLPGFADPSPMQMTELRVTYRFDQMDARGKAPDAVPVQMAFKIHNPERTQDVMLLIPLGDADGRTADLTAVYINGKEKQLPAPALRRFSGTDGDIRAASLPITVYENSDTLVDIRFSQPADANGFVFRMGTGRAWNGTLQTGSLEGIFPYAVQNWNASLRKNTDNALVPLTYQDNAARWSFENLAPDQANDVTWSFADTAAMDYFNRGNDLWTQTQGADPQSYEMMYQALLDMQPCGQVKMPLESWWNGMFDTIATGVIASTPEAGQERRQKALDVWSSRWAVPVGDDAACVSMRQRPDRYRMAASQILSITPDQRSSATQQTINNHFLFLRKVAAVSTDPNVNPNGITDESDPFQDKSLTAGQKQALAVWDSRFANPTTTETPPTATGSAAPFSFISSTINRIAGALPRLSLRTQIIIFIIFALLLLTIVSVLLFKWREKPLVETHKDPMPQAFGGLPIPPRNTSGTQEPKMNLMRGLGNPPAPTPPPDSKIQKPEAQSISPLVTTKVDDAKREPTKSAMNTPSTQTPDKTSPTPQNEIIKPKTPEPTTPPPTDLPWA